MKYDKGILILPSFVPDEYLYKIKTHLCKKKYNIDELYKVNQFLREVRKKVNKYDEIPF